MNQGLAASFTKRFSSGFIVRVDDLRTSSQGSVTVLVGASGSGKTTVLRCLAGLEHPDEGTLRFGGLMWSDSAKGFFLEPQRRNVGFVPQDYALFPHLSVYQNIAYGLSKLASSERQKQVVETLDWLGLSGLERRLPKELSGGQQQRVALARAVVPRPRLLLLDEPLSALDVPTRLRLRSELGGLLRQLNIPTLFVTHDRQEALALGDHLFVMHEGSTVQQGPAHEVFG
jgi:molybdate transport system ATP-binding protein